MNAEELINRAKLSIKVKDFDQAVKFLNKVTKLEPNISGINILLGIIHQSQKNYKKAIGYYNNALKVNDDDIDALNNLGIIYKETQEYEKSLGYLEKALSLDPKRADVLYNIGNVYKSIGKNEDAIKYFQKALQLNPNFRFAYNNLGTVFEELGEIDKAINVFQKGLKVDPNNPRLHYNLGIAYEYKNNLDVSLEEFKKALKINPNLIEAHNNLGVIYEKINRLEDAAKSYNNALKINPNYTKSLNNLALVYEKLGDIENAISNYKKAIKVDPKYNIARINLGRTYFNSNDYKNAKKIFEDIIRNNPDNLDAYHNLAKTEDKLGNTKKAIEIYKFILESNNDINIRNELKDLYITFNMYDEAKQELLKIKQMSGADIERLLNVARSYYNIKDNKEAFKIIDEILKKSPDNTKALLLASDIYISIKDYDKALKILNKLEKMGVKDNILNHNYALCYQGTGKMSKAVALMERIIEKTNIQKPEDSSDNDFDLLNNLINGYEYEMQKLEKQDEEEKKRIRKILHDIDFKSILEGTRASIDSIEKNDKIGKLELDEELKQLKDDDLPILNIGDTEPDYLIEEEEEDINLKNLEEEKDKEEEDKKKVINEETNSLINLLEGEDTYSDKLYDGLTKNIDMSKRVYQNLSNYSMMPLLNHNRQANNSPLQNQYNEVMPNMPIIPQTSEMIPANIPVQIQTADDSQSMMSKISEKFNEIDEKLNNFKQDVVEKKLEEKLQELDDKLLNFKENLKKEFEENEKYTNIDINNENPLKSSEEFEYDIEVDGVGNDTETLDSSDVDEEVTVDEEDEDIYNYKTEKADDNINLYEEDEDFMTEDNNLQEENENKEPSKHLPETGPFEKLRTLDHNTPDKEASDTDTLYKEDVDTEIPEEKSDNLDLIPLDESFNDEVELKEEVEDFDEQSQDVASCKEPELFSSVDSSDYSQILDYFPPVDLDELDDFEVKSSSFEQQIKDKISDYSTTKNATVDQSPKSDEQDINFVFKIQTKKIKGREIDIFY